MKQRLPVATLQILDKGGPCMQKKLLLMRQILSRRWKLARLSDSCAKKANKKTGPQLKLPA